MKSVLVIGGGLAGLTAANHLQAAGRRVQVIDKGRGIGGRLATRRVESAVFDYGAQYFTVRDSQFAAVVDQWQQQNVVRIWSNGFGNSAGELSSDGHPRYVGVGGMRGIAKHLANGLSATPGIKIESIHYDGSEWLATANGAAYRGEALIVTPPVPQSLALLDAGGVDLAPEHREPLKQIEYHPCLAALVTLAGPSNIPDPGGLFLSEGPLSWIADNTQKHVSPQTCAVTLHAGPEFSRNHYEEDLESVGQKLVSAAEQWLGSDVIEVQVHRWRYSLPFKTFPERCLKVENSLVFAGDAFGGPRIEGAVLSGLAAAKAILED